MIFSIEPVYVFATDEAFDGAKGVDEINVVDFALQVETGLLFHFIVLLES